MSHADMPWRKTDPPLDQGVFDMFAAHALAGLLSQTEHTESGYPCPRWDGNSDDRSLVCQCAWLIAKEMMKQRKKHME